MLKHTVITIVKTRNSLRYCIFPAIRRGFRPSRMTSSNLISPMKFCYNTNSTLLKQCQSSRSVLQDGSKTFGLFWKEKNPSYNRRNTVSLHTCRVNCACIKVYGYTFDGFFISFYKGEQLPCLLPWATYP